MNVMVMNCGSSSLKYKVIEMPSEKELAGGEACNVGPPTASPPCIVHHAGKVKKTVEVNEAGCKGCGSCMATCPKQGIMVAGFTLDQISAQVDAALGLA